MPARAEVIVNSTAGGVPDETTRDLLERELAAAGLEFELHFVGPGDSLDELAEKAAQGDREIIVAGGGDGTISAVASRAAKAKKVLGVLPLGTLNNFSKDLGIPQDIEEAVRVVAGGLTRVIDIAEVNGQTFINNSSIGLYPRIVRKREQQQRLGYGKWVAAAWAALRIFRISPFLKVHIRVDNETLIRKTPFVFVGNNEYEMDVYNIGRRASLDKGQLSVYFLKRGGRVGVLLLLFHTLTGGLKDWDDFEEVITDEITIETRRKWIHVAFDGEVAVMQSPLKYRSVPRALTVLVPENKGEDQ